MIYRAIARTHNTQYSASVRASNVNTAKSIMCTSIGKCESVHVTAHNNHTYNYKYPRISATHGTPHIIKINI